PFPSNRPILQNNMPASTRCTDIRNLLRIRAGSKTWPLRLSLAVVCIHAAFGQNGPKLSGARYGLPTYLTLAPVRIATLQRTGVRTGLLSPVQRLTAPPPTFLSGISVTLTQAVPTTVALAAPLLAISQRNHRSDFSSQSPGCRITFITVQSPFELV